MKKNSAKKSNSQHQPAVRITMKLTCQNCDNVFETFIFWRRFCSNACRQAAYVARKKK